MSRRMPPGKRRMPPGTLPGTRPGKRQKELELAEARSRNKINADIDMIVLMIKSLEARDLDINQKDRLQKIKNYSDHLESLKELEGNEELAFFGNGYEYYAKNQDVIKRNNNEKANQYFSSASTSELLKILEKKLGI